MAVPGRPILYRTTQNFLRSFGLSSLEELPDPPNSSAEDEQITLDMQMQVESLRKRGETSGGEQEPAGPKPAGRGPRRPEEGDL